MADRTLWVRLGLDQTKYAAGIDRAMLKTKQLGASVENMSKRMAATGKKMQSVGKSMSMYLTLPIAAAGAASVKFAADFETAMVEVQKVTDKVTADKLRGTIRQMAREIPLAQEALAGLAADAARFGVRGADNIESFTRAVAKMAEATDLTADQAGQALAKIANQANVPIPEIENLGSSINELSNNFATSSSEIVDSMLRSSATMSNFGLNAKQMTGLSAQMNAMSESAERAGSRLRRLFQTLMDPKKIEDVAGALGMTSKEFVRMRQNNPQQAIMMLVKAMARGGETANELKGVLGTTARTALTALAKNTGDVTRAMNMSSQAYRENTSLQKEFDAATNTFNARLTKFANRLRDVGITIGEMLLPYVDRLITKIESAVSWFRNLSQEMKQNVLKISGLVALIGPLTLGLGFLVGNVFPGLVKIVKTAATAFRVLTKVMMANPFIAIATALTAIVLAIRKAWKESAKFRAIIKFSVQKIGYWFKIVGKVISNVFGGVWDYVKGVASDIADFFTPAVNAIRDAFNWVKDKIVGIWEGIKDAGKSVAQWFGKVFNIEIPDGIKKGIDKAKDTIKDFADKATEGINKIKPPDYSKILATEKALQKAKEAGEKIGKKVQEGVQKAINFAKAFKGMDKLTGRASFEGIRTTTPETGLADVEGIIEKNKEMQKAFQRTQDEERKLSSVTSSLQQVFMNTFTNIKNPLANFFKYFTNWVGNMIARIASLVAAVLALTAILSFTNLGTILGLGTNFGSILKTLSGGGVGEMIGGIMGLDSGGQVTEGGLFNVHRNETIALPAGSAVTPARDTGAMNINITGRLVGRGDDLEAIITEAQRKKGNTL